MPSPTLVGAVLGLGVQVYANAVRKVPLLEGPWRHGAAMLAGAAFGSWLVDFEERTEKDLKGEDRGCRSQSPNRPIVEGLPSPPPPPLSMQLCLIRGQRPSACTSGLLLTRAEPLH